MIRVLNVIGTLDRGGVETWLRRVLYNIDTTEIRFDFCCLGDREGAYADEIKRLGSRVYVLNLKKGIIPFSKDYLLLLKKEKYDIVHSHVHFFSGYLAVLTKIAGIETFISHSHNTSDGCASNITRLIYRSFMRLFMLLLSDHLIAASTEAGKHLFGNSNIRSSRFVIIRCGVNVNNFKNKDLLFKVLPEYLKLREKVLILNIARFNTQKNHAFLVDVFRAILDIDKNFYLILVGDGPLRPIIQKRVFEYGIEGNVKFLGNIENASEIISFFDLFIMPSLYEGLPVAALEAQAAGLPVILSDKISKETAVVEELVTFLPLEYGASGWAKKVIELSAVRTKISINDIQSKFKIKGFSIDASLNTLISVYRKSF